ncbi:transmembrane GTPase Marf-like [Acyrthosiphon pisum]|uniref:Dynamin-type G domain-containing protein n=1 Tax=Acyrthosiphon pisum TaxID=7029 RepID=A0A8R2NJC5_ACYPI|nr:transmembrane GTPase Marf-like [Acyrthosiphon pisum]
MSTYQDFGLAKQKLNNIFLGILDYGVRASEHINDLIGICPDVIDRNELNCLLYYESQVEAIYEVFTHAHMKVAVFGRTSSGKSTVVNAMLRENVLPIGIGHTTNGFLQVERSLTGNAYLSTEGILPIQHNVESASYLAHVLKNIIKPNKKKLVHVYWPKENCGFLKDDVALVDSPGIDTTSCLDEWIGGHCINADAFVLVINAESTLIDSVSILYIFIFAYIVGSVTIRVVFKRRRNEYNCSSRQILGGSKFIRWLQICLPKYFCVHCELIQLLKINFLHKVSKKLPNTNIFILINCPDESELFDQERKQKMKNNINLLEKKLKEYTSHKPYSQIFFISAKEVLDFRVKVRSGLQPIIKPFSERYLEFIDFERQLENCISRSALLKFFNYSMHGKYLLSEMNTIMDIINIRSQEQTHFSMSQINEIQDKFNVTEEHFENITNQNSPITDADYSFSSFDDSLAVEPNLSSISRVSSRDVGTQGSVLGGIVLAGFMFKTIGWSSIIAAGAIYGGVCLYEYLSWTTKAKERSLKKQYIDHANSKLQLSVANYSRQVQQELSTTFAQSDQLFDEFAINHNGEIKNVESEPNILTKSPETAMIFINNEVYWLNEDFIQLHSFLMDRITFF